MDPLSFPGRYRDARGSEPIMWRIRSSTQPGWDRRFEIRTTIRGIDLWGADFDLLGPDDPSGPGVERLSIVADCLTDCVVEGELPCSFRVGTTIRSGVIHFRFDLRLDSRQPPAAPKNLVLSCLVDGVAYSVTDEWLEDGLQRIEAQFPGDTRLVACITCLYSDYSPAGHGLTEIRCHRGAKTQYLAVRSKSDYWSVPVTEEVPETYLCPEYEHRIPGTGYRG